jgi:hypothetical protein
VPGLLPSDRAGRERVHGLTPLRETDERTWQYRLSRWSSEDLRRLLSDGTVEDTAGIDRDRFVLLEPPRRRWMPALTMPVPGAGLQVHDNALALLYWLAWGLPCIAILGLFRYWHTTHASERTVTIMAVVIQLLMNAMMLRDPMALRIRDVLVPAVVLAASIAGVLLRSAGEAQRVWLTRMLATVPVLALAVTSAVVGEANEVLPRVGTPVWRQFDPPHERTGSRELAPLEAYLGSCTPPASRILTLAFAPQVFFLTERAFAAGHVALIPGYFTSPRDESRMLERIQREDVPFVVLDGDAEHELPLSWPRVLAHVRQRYREVLQIQDGQTLKVLAESERMPVRRYGTQDLPCFADPAG